MDEDALRLLVSTSRRAGLLEGILGGVVAAWRHGQDPEWIEHAMQTAERILAERETL